MGHYRKPIFYFDFYSILAQISGMKKSFLYILIVVGISAAFSGCIKKATDRTITPNMTVSFGTYAFSATDTYPTTITPQLNDSATSILVTGYDELTRSKVIIGIRKFNPKGGTYSIIAGEASASYIHNGITSVATGGIVAVKTVSSNTIAGYFSFTTSDGFSATNGIYEVGRPWNF